MSRPKPELTLADLKQAARAFATVLSGQSIGELYGVSDGKKVGTAASKSGSTIT